MGTETGRWATNNGTGQWEMETGLANVNVEWVMAY